MVILRAVTPEAMTYDYLTLINPWDFVSQCNSVILSSPYPCHPVTLPLHHRQE